MKTIEKIKIQDNTINHTEKQTSLYAYLYNKFQNKIMAINLLIIITIFIFELLFIPIHIIIEKQTINILSYIILNVFIPTTSNLIIWFTGRQIIRKYQDNIIPEIYEAMPLYILTLIIVVSIIIHYNYPVLYTLIACPIFMCIVYGSNKVNWQLFLISQFEIITISLSSISELNKLPSNYLIYMFLSCIITIFAYIYSRLVIKYEKEKELKLVLSENRNAQLLKEISQDGLTRLDNYRSLFNTTKKWISYKKKLYFCIIDIDDFKSVNDTYGHEFGNTVLINLAKELQNINQSNIFIARYGGEEFGILFADYEYTEAYNIINDIRIKFNNIKYENIPQQFTFSGGITEYKKNNTVHDLFDAADKNLYKAKRTGKNKIM